MSRLCAVDLMLIDEIVASDRGAGYVLNFTDVTFSDFFRSEVQVNINDRKYCSNGTSKAKRLRAFFQIEPDVVVARTLRSLWEYREAMPGPKASDDTAARQQERFFALVHAIDGKGFPKPVQPKASSRLVSPSSQALAALNCQYLALMSIDAHSRGFAFEKFLADLFGLYELDPRRSFRLRGAD